MASSTPTSSHDEDSTFERRQQEVARELRESEKKAEDEAKAAEDDEAKRQSRRRITSRLFVRRITRTSTGIFAIIALIAGVGIFVLLSPSFLLINMKEQLTTDLNDGLGFYYTMGQKVMENQLKGGAGCGEGDDTIKCKFTTMSLMLRDRYKSYGFKVADNGQIPLSDTNRNSERVKVRSVQFPAGGGSAQAGSLYKTANQSDHNRQMLNRIYSLTTSIYHSRGFADRLHGQFGIVQNGITHGSNQKEVIQAFNQNLGRESDYADNDGYGRYGLHYIVNAKDDVWRKQLFNGIMDKSRNHMNTACAAYTYGATLHNVLQKAKETTAARFAMQYMALADMVKFGQNSALEQTVGTMMNNLTSLRKRQGSNEGVNGTEASSYRVPAMGEAPTKNRMPDERTYMVDPTGIFRKIMAYARQNDTIIAAPDSSSGAGPQDVRKRCFESMSNAQAKRETSSPATCWAESLKLAGLIGPGSLAAVEAKKKALEAATGQSPPKCMSPEEHAKTIVDGARGAAEPLSLHYNTFKDTARQEAKRYQMALKTEDGVHGTQTMDAIFAGTGVILGDMAQWLGMRPADKRSLTDYLRRTAKVRQTLVDAQLRRAKDRPFDTSTPYSFIGMTLAKTFNLQQNHQPVTRGYIARASLGLLGQAARQVGGRVTLAASQVDASDINGRLINGRDCQVNQTIARGVNPDFSCAMRYSVDEATLKKDVDGVLNFMTRDNPNDQQGNRNADQVASRDVGSAAGEGDRMKKESSEARAKSYIDKKTGQPNKYTEYWKFLEYCSNRRTPWGSAGMAMAARKDTYEPDIRDPVEKGPRKYSLPYYPDKPPEENEINDDNDTPSYYALAWGGDSDYKWITGQRCLETDDTISNFRAYTAMCSILGAMSGSRYCWQDDAVSRQRDDFATTNGIIYVHE